jgi:p-aminobenzoyl-glutamate transporter AbgT
MASSCACNRMAAAHFYNLLFRREAPYFISPEMTTAAYRVGDTVTNLISPLNPYVVLTLTFCRRWIPDFRPGSLLALMCCP